VDQIWLMSVFGGFHTVPEKLPDGTSQYTLGLDGVFQELSRIAKRGGKIYIGELYAPMDESPMWLTDIDYSDFDLEKKVYKGREEIISVLEKIAGGPIGSGASYLMEGDPKYTPFFIELTKK
jgi:hypothetical protein